VGGCQATSASRDDLAVNDQDSDVVIIDVDDAQITRRVGVSVDRHAAPAHDDDDQDMELDQSDDRHAAADLDDSDSDHVAAEAVGVDGDADDNDVADDDGLVVALSSRMMRGISTGSSLVSRTVGTTPPPPPPPAAVDSAMAGEGPVLWFKCHVAVKGLRGAGGEGM
jgi:hypothetical protein